MEPFKISWKQEALFVLVVLAVSALLLWMPGMYESPYQTQEERCRGIVEESDDSLIQQYGILKAGSQTLKVRIVEGPHAGKRVEATNDLIGKMESDKMFKKGDRAFLVFDGAGGDNIRAVAYDHYRLGVEGWLLLIFVVLLVAVAPFTALVGGFLFAGRK